MANTTTQQELGEQIDHKPVMLPELPYRPRNPKSYRPAIGLIACGMITDRHLKAYRKAGYNVVALCDPCRDRAEQRQKEFYPEAAVYTDYRDVLRRDDIEVLDIATHPAERVGIIRAALEARKHILSQKPFVTDLDVGQRLIELAHKQGCKLAVNQNGRWAPHWSYMRHAIDAGLVGQILGAHFRVHWNHNWVAGTAFDYVRHIILYDFAVHWFDILMVFMGQRQPNRIYASFTPSCAQQAKPALLAQAAVEFDGAQASLAFDGDAKFGPVDQTYLAGTQGSLRSSGPDLADQSVTIYTAEGCATHALEGSWFPDGFHGTMAELLCAIEENRQPSNSAESTLRSLGLCFAAVAAAETGQPQTPGEIRKLPA